VSALPLVKARYVLETEIWNVNPVTEKSSTHELLATGISAYHTGDNATLEKAASQIRVVAEKQAADASLYDRQAQPTRVAQYEIEALDALAKGDGMGAIEHIKKGVELAESMPPPRGAPNPVKPAHELAGEILLKIGQAEEAVLFYQTQLSRTPGRVLSIRGLARAYSALGNRVLAGEQYRKLQNIWSEHSVAGLKEASDYLASTDSGGQ
jgi:tetratricopeptide (TPR) repeat protein